jgi:peptide/nickel transport system permease protein
MAVTTGAYVADEVFERPPLASRLWAIVRAQPLGIAGAFIVFVMIFAALFAPYISPYDPELNDFGAMLIPPDGGHWLGTDEFGRDIFSRLVWGSRTAMLVGFSCALLGSTIGLLIGVASAYFGGLFDLIVQRVVDVFLAFPLIIMALAVVATLGPGVENVIIAIIIPFVPQCARVVRSSALSIREIPYVDAARALGYSHTRIILRHMAPNVMAPFLIMLTYFVGQAILLEAVLSYLGMGVQDPTPAWGLMLKGGAEEFLESASWLSIFPGLAITLAVFGFNLFGDALRDLLDPKLRSR